MEYCSFEASAKCLLAFPLLDFIWFSFVILRFHLAVVLHFISFFPAKLLDYLMCVSAPLQAVNSVELQSWSTVQKLKVALFALFLMTTCCPVLIRLTTVAPMQP